MIEGSGVSGFAAWPPEVADPPLQFRDGRSDSAEALDRYRNPQLMSPMKGSLCSAAPPTPSSGTLLGKVLACRARYKGRRGVHAFRVSHAGTGCPTLQQDQHMRLTLSTLVQLRNQSILGVTSPYPATWIERWKQGSGVRTYRLGIDT